MKKAPARMPEADVIERSPKREADFQKYRGSGLPAEYRLK